MKKNFLLILLSTLLILACKNKIEESTEVSELTNKQSPTEFFSYASEDILIDKTYGVWGPSELKPYGRMGQRLIEDIKVNGLNSKGYIFYRKQKFGEIKLVNGREIINLGRKNLVLIKYGPLIISDSIYNKIKPEDFGAMDAYISVSSASGGDISNSVEAAAEKYNFFLASFF